MLNHISYSYLHLLVCPYAAFLRYEAAIKSPVNEYLALGNALHLALELGHRADVFDPPYAYSVFEKEYNRIIEEDEVFIGYPKRKKMEADGAAMLALYTRQVDSGVISATAYKHEQEFKIPYEGINIIGKIDKVEYTPQDGYTIIDYKSGAKEPDLWFLRHNMQLTAYAWACQEMYGELPRKLVWHHLRNGKLLETQRTQEDIDQLKKIISNAIFMDKNDIKHRVYHEQICNWCPYSGPGNACEDTELEKRVISERTTKRQRN